MRRLTVSAAVLLAMLASPAYAFAQSADVSVQASGPSSLAVGASGSFTFDVANAGPDAAESVALAVTLPTTVRLSGSSNPGGVGTCSSPSGAGGTVTCNRGTVASGGSGTVSLSVRGVAAGDAQVASAVTSSTADPSPGNGSASSALSVTPSNADLGAGIFGPSTALLGSTVSWNVGVVNNGPDPVSNAVLTISLPVSTSNIGFSFAGFTQCFFGTATTCFGSGPLTCSIPNPEPSPPVVTCTALSLSPGQSQSFTLHARVNTVGPTTVGVSITSDDLADPNPGSNTGSAMTSVLASADLGLTVSAPGNVGVGDELDYGLAVQNAGPSAATGVATTTTLPAAMELVSAPAGCSGTTTVVCSFGGVAVGGSATKTVRLRALSLDNATIASTVDGAEADPAGGNDASSAIVSVTSAPLPPGADLSVSIAGTSSLAVGASGSLIFTVTNNGPDPATDSRLVVTIPSFLRVSFTNNSGGVGACTGATGSPGGTVTCQRGTLTNLQTGTVTLGVTAVAAGSTSVGASVTTTATDPVAANNSAAHVVQVGASNADLFVHVSGPSRALTGAVVAFTVSAGNSGPDPVGAVTLTFPLPASFSATGFSFAGLTQCFFGAATTCFGSGPFTCSFPTPQPSPVTVTCTALGLAAGASQTFTLNATANASGTHDVTGSIAGTDVNDPNPANNSSTATVRVFDGSFPIEADVQVTKTAPATAQPGQQIEYSIVVRNNGPDTATAVTLTDTLPAQVSFVSASGATCTGTTTLTCDLGSLTSFQSKTVTLTVEAQTEGTASNTASVSAAETDLFPSNNSATATTQIRAPTSDLVLTASGPSTVVEQRPLSYTITVRNNGPDTTSNVRIHGTLGPGLSLDFGNFDCTGSGGTFSCLVGFLFNGVSDTVTLALRAGAPGPSSLGLTVTQANVDPDSTNSALSIPIEITPRPVVDISATHVLPANVEVGETFSYTVRVANAGPNASGSIHVSAYVPTGAFDQRAVTSPASGCSLSTASASIGPGILADGAICTIAGLAPGASTDVTISMRAVAAGDQLFVAQAVRDGLETETNGSDNVDIDTLTVGTPLAISCPPNISASTDEGSATATVAVGSPTTTGGTGTVSVTGARSDGLALDAPYPIGTTTIEWTAADQAGQSQTCTQAVSVTDNEAPTIVAPADITVGTDDGAATAHVAALGAPTAADNGGSVSVSPSGVPPGNVFPLGTTAVTWIATDGSGNSASATQSVTVVDDDAPNTSASAPSGWSTSTPVVVTLTASDAASGVREIRYGVGGAEQVVAGATADVNVTAEGATEITFHAVDNAGNAEAPQTVTVQIDTAAPTVMCEAPDGAWHDDDVSLGCTAADEASRLADAAEAAFSLSTSVPAGSVDANASTGSRQVCDVAGNCATAGPIAGNKVDREAPTVSIAAPAEAATFTQGSSVSTSFTCADGAGSGIVSCTGPSTVPTSALGPGTLSVTATDVAGNSTMRTVAYTVVLPEFCLGEIARRIRAPINADGSSVFKQGRTVAVGFRICDGAGTPISTPGLVTGFALVRIIAGMTSTDVNEAPLSTTPDTAFRWSEKEQQWVFSLATSNLVAGRTYVYRVSLSDGTSFEFRFSLR